MPSSICATSGLLLECALRCTVDVCRTIGLFGSPSSHTRFDCPPPSLDCSDSPLHLLTGMWTPRPMVLSQARRFAAERFQHSSGGWMYLPQGGEDLLTHWRRGSIAATFLASTASPPRGTAWSGGRTPPEGAWGLQLHSHNLILHARKQRAAHAGDSTATALTHQRSQLLHTELRSDSQVSPVKLKRLARKRQKPRTNCLIVTA
jgi:hypothetical protein